MQRGFLFWMFLPGEFFVAQGNFEYIDKLFQSFQPSEVIFQKNKQKQFITQFGDRFYTYCLEDWVFTTDYGQDILLGHFGTKSLKGYGIEELHLGVIAAGAAMHYLKDTQHNKIDHLSSISRLEEDRYVWLDKFTIRNLELIHSPHQDARTLLDVMDETISPMGSRMLKRWMALPLKHKSPINERLQLVDFFMRREEVAETIRQQIHLIGDLERLISKVAVARVNPREVLQLQRALQAIGPVIATCLKTKDVHLKKLAEQLNPCDSIRIRIEQELAQEPAAAIGKGNVIAEGVKPELDELRELKHSGKDHLLKMQQREMERTGISSLKVAFNNVFGYYIEVRNAHKDKVPPEWIRKQTLVNAERYITEELKEYESKILGAEEKIIGIGNKLVQRPRT